MAPEAKVLVFWNLEMTHITIITTVAIENGSGNIAICWTVVVELLGVTTVELTATQFVPLEVKFAGQEVKHNPR